MEQIVRGIIDNRMNTLFEWGKFDCLTLAADLITTLFECENPHDGAYTTREEAYEYEKSHSYIGGLQEYPHEKIDWGHEVTGDLVMVESKIGGMKLYTAGIVYNHRVVMINEPIGVCLLPSRVIRNPAMVLRYKP